MRKWPVCDFSSRGWKTLDSAVSPARCRYWVGKAGVFLQWERKECNREYSDKISIGSNLFKICFLPLSPAPSPASSSADNAKFSFSFPACCTFAAGDNFCPGYFPRPAKPRHVKGQKIYKPALSSHISQGTLSVSPTGRLRHLEILMGTLKIMCPLLGARRTMKSCKGRQHEEGVVISEPLLWFP